jgi:methyl-accepting chemotaxis protein
MDETTQQNAALVEEAAAAAESLVDQANQLADAISQFKLEGKSLVGGQTHKSASKLSPVKVLSQISGLQKGIASASKAKAEGTFSKSSSSVSVTSANSANLSRRTGTEDSDWEEF